MRQFTSLRYLLLAVGLLTGLAQMGCGKDTQTSHHPVVLVHGAWMGAWAFDDAMPELTQRGLSVRVVELPAHGADTTDPADVDLGAYVDTVAAAVNAEADPVVLVGHSMAGMVISQVAEDHPDRIARLVYVAAYLPADGQSLLDLAYQDADATIGAHLVFNPDDTVSVEESALGDVFCADCSASALSELVDKSRAEPVGPLGEPVALTSERFGAVDKAYLTTTQDHAVSPALQQQMYTDAAVNEILDLDSSHCPFLADPSSFASTVERVSRK